MTQTERGFTRIELLFCIISGSILAGMAVSLLAGNKSESQRTICFNNLRQIGRGFQMWAADHEDLFPWQVNWDNGSGEGTRGHPLAANAWFHYAVVSNQFGSPKILACPADPQKHAATRWDLSPGGFLNAAYRNNGLSYPLLLHALANSPSSLLSADRNFRVDQFGSGCTYVPSPVCFSLFGQGNATWTNAVHGLAGHLLFSDGAVQFTTSSELRRAVSPVGQDDNGTSVHGLPVN